MTLASAPREKAPEGHGADGLPTRPSGDGPRRLRGALVGVVVAAVSYAALSSGLLPGPVGVLVLALLVLAVPTADDVATRISRNGLVVLGWTPVLWAVRLPTLDRGALLVAVGAGVLAGWLASSIAPSASARRLVPAVRPVDVLLPVSAVLAIATMWRFLAVDSPRQALALLLPGYDNVAHFDMFRMAWKHGGIVDTVPHLPGQPGWAYDGYPQGVHPLLASVAQLRYPDGTSDAHSLVVYTHGLGGVVVVGVVVTVATLLSVPGLRGRGWLAVPVVSLVLTAFLWNPGGWVVEDGFVNYWLAAVLAGCAYALACSRLRSVPTVVDEAALMGCMVGAVLGWAPLLGVCAVAGLVGSGLLRRAAWSWSWATAARVALGLLAACVGVRTLVALATSVPSAALLGAQGAIHSMSPVPVLVLLILYGWLLSMGRLVRPRGASGAERAARRRELALASGVAVGVVLCAVVAVLQVRATGTTSYYFVKLFMGFGLVLVVATSALVLSTASAWTAPTGRHRQRSLAIACLVVAVLVTQLFGRVTPGGAPQLVGVPHPTDDHGRGLSWSRMAAGVLEARAAVPAGSAASYEYVALGGRRGYRGDLPNAWFHALSGTLLAKPAGLDLALDGPVDAREPIQAILDTNPAAQVLVPGPQLDAVRAHLGSSDAARVHGTG